MGIFGVQGIMLDTQTSFALVDPVIAMTFERSSPVMQDANLPYPQGTLKQHVLVNRLIPSLAEEMAVWSHNRPTRLTFSTLFMHRATTMHRSTWIGFGCR